MNVVLRALVVYVLLWLLFRVIGRRTMAQMTAFDFVLLLLCGDAAQQALLGRDDSITNAALVLLSLVFIDDAVTKARARSKAFERITEGVPILLCDYGRLLETPMAKEQIDEDDLLHAARQIHAIEKLEDIEKAYLETSGDITVIPRRRRTRA